MLRPNKCCLHSLRFGTRVNFPGLQRPRAQAVVILAVKALLRDMASPTVLEHFKAMLLGADH